MCSSWSWSSSKMSLGTEVEGGANESREFEADDSSKKPWPRKAVAEVVILEVKREDPGVNWGESVPTSGSRFRLRYFLLGVDEPPSESLKLQQRGLDLFSHSSPISIPHPSLFLLGLPFLGAPLICRILSQRKNLSWNRARSLFRYLRSSLLSRMLVRRAEWRRNLDCTREGGSEEGDVSEVDIVKSWHKRSLTGFAKDGIRTRKEG